MHGGDGGRGPLHPQAAAASIKSSQLSPQASLGRAQYCIHI